MPIPDPNWTDRNALGVGPLSISATLLNAIRSNGFGPWVDTRGLTKLSSEVVPSEDFAGSVQIYGTNDPDPRLDNTVFGGAIGVAKTGADLATFDGPYRFIRAGLASHSAGSVTVYLHGTT